MDMCISVVQINCPLPASPCTIQESKWERSRDAAASRMFVSFLARPNKLWRCGRLCLPQVTPGEEPPSPRLPRRQKQTKPCIHQLEFYTLVLRVVSLGVGYIYIYLRIHMLSKASTRRALLRHLCCTRVTSSAAEVATAHWLKKPSLQFMLYGWGFVYPSFIQKAAALLLQDIQAAGRGELDLTVIERLANVYLSRSL